MNINYINNYTIPNSDGQLKNKRQIRETKNKETNKKRQKDTHLTYKKS